VSRVAIITDSSSCLPLELYQKYGIGVVPVMLTIDGKGYRDLVDISPDEFWERLPTMKQHSTGATSPGEFLNAFEKASQDTDRIVCITIAKAMSAVHQSAIIARNLIKVGKPWLNIELIDSRTVVGALGFIVLEAARAARALKSLSEVTRIAQDMMGRVKWVVGFETNFTATTGRIPQSAYTGISGYFMPMAGQLDGTDKVEDLGNAANKDQCLQKIIEIVNENIRSDRTLNAIVHYTTSIEDGKRLLQMVQEQFTCGELYLNRYTAMLGASSGPAITMAFYT
jgi:DegV family protein with EDD domain